MNRSALLGIMASVAAMSAMPGMKEQERKVRGEFRGGGSKGGLGRGEDCGDKAAGTHVNYKPVPNHSAVRAIAYAKADTRRAVKRAARAAERLVAGGARNRAVVRALLVVEKRMKAKS
jgi:hypothetical protein